MKILITGAWANASAHFETLQQMGHDIAFLQNESDVLPCEASQVQAVVCNGLFVHHDHAAFTALRYVQLTSAGYDRVPLEAMQKRGITVWNARGVYSIPMAEFALCGVLSLYKHSRLFHEKQAHSQWDKDRTLLELYGKTVAIVGCGSVGTECAKRFSAFGCEVIGVDLTSGYLAHYDSVVELGKLDSLLPIADIVLLTLPLTKQTHQLMNAKRLFAMKKGALLVNIARGAIVCETALINALKEHLGGAVLDVFETEPLAQTSPLWQMPNVMLTPHNSFVGEGNAQRVSTLILSHINRIEK